MTKQIWINLPVKNVAASVAFFKQLGFSFNTKHANNVDSACMLVGEKGLVIMFFPEETFKQFTGNELMNSTKTTEVLFSIDAENMEEVNTLATLAHKAGGAIFSPPQMVQGWMYGCGFCDLDGHRWNALYMDYEKLNTTQNND
jgi:uncharacterized protein